MKTLTLFLFLAASGLAQGKTRTVVLTWQDANNPTGTVYNVYRGGGDCSTSPVFASIASGVTLLTWTDPAVSIGKYCYYVTANYAGLESDPSNNAPAKVQPFPASGLSVAVQ